MSEHEVRVTPYLGGKTDGPVCCLLEIGGARILLDCGCTVDFDAERLLEISNDLLAGGGVDAVVLSHADMHHLGGLPIVFGRFGLGGVPVVCTTPVSKFGKMVLYDLCMNNDMDGIPEEYASSSSSSSSDAAAKYKHKARFEFDDIDLALSNVTTVKFSQTVPLPGISDVGSRRLVTLCAYPSGRTIGGSMWRIRHGATEVVYCMDVNLKRETVLDGAGLGLLPSVPELLIVEGGSVSRFAPSPLGSTVPGKKRKDKDDATGLIAAVMETMRNDGNVLIPCESGARVLELMQILGKHWIDHKLGMYHLVFLSHMSYNIMEYARSQLEWMSDSLAKEFYNGKPNPFDLAHMKVCTSLRELERSCPGPKVVFSTDASLSCGLSKALLLRWGGDPRCRVIFTDTCANDDKASLAAELRTKGVQPPVVAVVAKPTRVLLVGEELEAYQAAQERSRRLREETEQRRRREEEIAQLASARDASGGLGPAGEEDDDDDDDGDDLEIEETRPPTALVGESAVPTTLPTSSSSSSSAALLRSVSGSSSSKRRKLLLLQPSKIAQFLEPRFAMFESKETVLSTDDYGASNEDLTFQDITAATFSRYRTHPALLAAAAAAASGGAAASNAAAVATAAMLMASANANASMNSSSSASAAASSSSSASRGVGIDSSELGVEGSGMNMSSSSSDAPWKLVGIKAKVQFTCGLREVSLVCGRADYKAVKTIITKLAPVRVLVLRGSEADCQTIAAFARTVTGATTSATAFAPANREVVSFVVQTSRVRLQIPQVLLPPGIKVVRGQGLSQTLGDVSKNTGCQVCAISGRVVELAVSGREGIRVMRLQPHAVTAAAAASTSGEEAEQPDDTDALDLMQVEGEEQEEEDEEKEGVGKVEGKDALERLASIDAEQGLEEEAPLETENSLSVGVVSVGEVLLNNLKQAIELTGVPVEFRLTDKGGVLVCGGQVLIRKDGDNDFVVEGPPSQAYWEARKALYQQYAFV